jgi:hypothetical protein
MNLRCVIAECLAHFAWCSIFAMLYLFLAWAGLSDSIIACVYPLAFFYSLYFWYDKTARWINRKIGAVLRV